MANPYHHALSSVKQYGGIVEDYQAIHDWFDKSKAQRADPLHRALRHHSEGIFTCEEVFGNTITLSTCARCGRTEERHVWVSGAVLLPPSECVSFKPKVIPTRWIGEQHVREDLGFIPTANQWLDGIPMQPWMTRSRKLSKELDAPERREYNDGPKDAAWHEAQREMAT